LCIFGGPNKYWQVFGFRQVQLHRLYSSGSNVYIIFFKYIYFELCASVEQINIMLLFSVVCDGNRITLCFKSNWFRVLFEKDRNQKF
jgi:hypothetical protein